MSRCGELYSRIRRSRFHRRLNRTALSVEGRGFRYTGSSALLANILDGMLMRKLLEAFGWFRFPSDFPFVRQLLLLLYTGTVQLLQYIHSCASPEPTAMRSLSTELKGMKAKLLLRY